MRIKIAQLRSLIREAIEESIQLIHLKESSEMEENEFTWKIAKAAKAGKKKVNVGGKKFPVKMSKKKADAILDEEDIDEDSM